MFTVQCMLCTCVAVSLCILYGGLVLVSVHGAHLHQMCACAFIDLNRVVVRRRAQACVRLAFIFPPARMYNR